MTLYTLFDCGTVKAKMFFTNWFKKEPIKRNRFQNTIDILNNLKNIYDFRCLYSSDYKIIYITTLYSNISLYNKALEQIIYCLENNVYIPKQIISSNNYETNIYEFLLDANKRFLNVNDEMNNFINNSIELLSVYNDREYESNQTAELSRNLYLSQFVVSNLISIVKGFEDVKS